MYSESQELKDLTSELKKDNLSRRDAQAFETVDWYIKTMIGWKARELNPNETIVKTKIINLIRTWE